MAAIVIQHRLNSFLSSFVLGQPQYTEDISYFSLILCLQYASNDKICCYCLQKNADISKLKGALVLKGIFSETTETTYKYVLMCQTSSF